MTQENERYDERERLDSDLDDIVLDAAGLDGKVAHNFGGDHSLARQVGDYDENSGPGGASGIADDPYLGGATGTADDVGMHIEEGFSVGYDTTTDLDFTGESGNELMGGYTSLAEAAQEIPVGFPDDATDQQPGQSDAHGLETSLGVSDVGNTNRDDNYSLDIVSGGPTGYGFEGTDSDTDLDEVGD